MLVLLCDAPPQADVNVETTELQLATQPVTSFGVQPTDDELTHTGMYVRMLAFEMGAELAVDVESKCPNAAL